MEAQSSHGVIYCHMCRKNKSMLHRKIKILTWIILHFKIKNKRGSALCILYVQGRHDEYIFSVLEINKRTKKRKKSSLAPENLCLLHMWNGQRDGKEFMSENSLCCTFICKYKLSLCVGFGKTTCQCMATLFNINVLSVCMTPLLLFKKHFRYLNVTIIT